MVASKGRALPHLRFSRANEERYVNVEPSLYQRFNGSAGNFDGAGRDAKDNNTLYLEAWIAF